MAAISTKRVKSAYYRWRRNLDRRHADVTRTVIYRILRTPLRLHMIRRLRHTGESKGPQVISWWRVRLEWKHLGLRYRFWLWVASGGLGNKAAHWAYDKKLAQYFRCGSGEMGTLYWSKPQPESKDGTA